jgi:hypothetical protein
VGGWDCGGYTFLLQWESNDNRCCSLALNPTTHPTHSLTHSPTHSITHLLSSLGPTAAQINHLGFFFWYSIFIFIFCVCFLCFGEEDNKIQAEVVVVEKD